MKDLLFSNDLLTIFQYDSYYSTPKNLSVALRKFGLQSVERSNNIEQMRQALVVNIIDKRGESEPFLSETFIEPQAVIALLKEQGLPVPGALQQPGTAKDNSNDMSDPAQFEKLFDTVCRNCGTVTDPLGRSYQTPIGRLIFKTLLATRQNLGIRTTGKYVFEHLKEYDSDQVVTAIEDDAVFWKVDEDKTKIMSTNTIEKLVLQFDREVENILS